MNFELLGMAQIAYAAQDYEETGIALFLQGIPESSTARMGFDTNLKPEIVLDLEGRARNVLSEILKDHGLDALTLHSEDIKLQYLNFNDNSIPQPEI